MRTFVCIVAVSLLIKFSDGQSYNKLIKRQLNYWTGIIDRLKSRNDKIFETKTSGESPSSRRRNGINSAIIWDTTERPSERPRKKERKKKTELVTAKPLDLDNAQPVLSLILPDKVLADDNKNSTLGSNRTTLKRTVLRVEPRKQLQQGGTDSGTTFNLNANSNANADPVITNQFNPSQVFRVLDSTLGAGLGVVPYVIPIVTTVGAGVYQHQYDLARLHSQRRRQCPACRAHLTRVGAVRSLTNDILGKTRKGAGFGSALRRDLGRVGRKGFGSALETELQKFSSSRSNTSSAPLRDEQIRFSPLPFRSLNPFVQILASYPHFTDNQRNYELEAPSIFSSAPGNSEAVRPRLPPDSEISNIRKTLRGLPTSSFPRLVSREILEIDPLNLGPRINNEKALSSTTESQKDDSETIGNLSLVTEQPQNSEETQLLISPDASDRSTNGESLALSSAAQFPDYSSILPGENEQSEPTGFWTSENDSGVGFESEPRVPFFSGSGLIDPSKQVNRKPPGTFGSGRQPDSSPFLRRS